VRVAIGTPGRLLDFADQRKLDLRKVGILVIDEADRLFDMGFIPDLRRLIRQMPGRDERITMLYSATLSMRVKTLAFDYMRSPAEITITPERVTVDEISQELYHVARERKFSLLLGLMARDQPENALIFTNTKQAAFEVATRMQRNGLGCEYIIGDLPQSKRQSLIDQLKAGELRYLVATDVAARGLHIEGLDLVVNYELPEYSENYVHRIGRTARAGRSGKAIALACEEYVFALEGIEEFIRNPITVSKATDDLYLEDLTGGARLGHYSGTRGRDDRRRTGDRQGAPRRSSGRSSAGGRERRTPELVGASAARSGRSGAGGRDAEAAAASDRAPGAAARYDDAPSRATPREREAGRTQSRRRGTRGGSRSGDALRTEAGAPAGGDTVSAPNGALVDADTRGAGRAAAPRRGGDREQGQARRASENGGRPRSSRTAEERLAHYREKYGEDFKVVDPPASAPKRRPAATVPKSRPSATGSESRPAVTAPESRPAANAATEGKSAAAGQGLLSRLFGKRSRAARKPD
jgi:ATP-dependent RNA helicase RhlB